MSTETPNPKSKHPWQREYAALLHRVCILISKRAQQGRSVWSSCRSLSKRYHGRPFACDPKRKLRLRPKTLYSIYRRWCRDGEKALVLKYRSQRPSAIDAAVKRQFIARALAPGVHSLLAGYRLLNKDGSAPRSYRQFHRALRTAERNALRRLHRARVEAAQAERQAAALLEAAA